MQRESKQPVRIETTSSNRNNQPESKQPTGIQTTTTTTTTTTTCHMGVVSLTFLELFKTLSRNLCIAEIYVLHKSYLMRILRWHFVRVPKGRLWAQVQWVQLEVLTPYVISGTVYIRENILESATNVSETALRTKANQLGWWAVWHKSDVSPKLNRNNTNKEELSQT